jgi:hypothetical protein
MTGFDDECRCAACRSKLLDLAKATRDVAHDFAELESITRDISRIIHPLGDHMKKDEACRDAHRARSMQKAVRR